MFILFSQQATSQLKIDPVIDDEKKILVSNFIKIRYYYYPNLQAYYDTQKGQYVYQKKGNWERSEFLDFNSRGYCLKNRSYEMIKGYTGEEPFLLLNEHKLKYPADYSSKPKRKLITLN